MYDYKRLLGELFGAGIAVVWVSFAILGAANMIFLVVAISLTIIFGILSGGFLGLSRNTVEVKEFIGWLFGGSIAVVWIVWAILTPGDLLGLVIAITVSIIFGVLSGGFISLSRKKNE
jgi:hypothetical protein